MKTREIEVGGLYSNQDKGVGKVREVKHIVQALYGDFYVYYESSGKKGHCTLRYFSQWARRRIEEATGS